MKAKKLLSILLSLTMAVTAFAAFAVNASAEDLFESTAINNNKTKSFMLTDAEEISDFKFTASKSGSLKISLRSDIEIIRIMVFDSKGTLLKPNKYNATSGGMTWNEKDSKENILRCRWQSSTKLFLGTATYKVNKGKYYIRIQRGSAWLGSSNVSGKGNVKLTATYPSSESSSSDVKINNLTLTMKVGDKIQLGTALSASTDDNVAWKSSKTSVAKVSATGLVTAKAAGTTTITASIGSSTQKIDIKVTK